MNRWLAPCEHSWQPSAVQTHYQAGRVTLAGKPGGDLPDATLKSILRQAGLKYGMLEYTIIYERGNDGGWGAYVPDLPGLGVAAETREEVHQLISDGIEIPIAGLLEHGLPISEPSSYAGLVAVSAA